MADQFSLHHSLSSNGSTQDPTQLLSWTRVSQQRLETKGHSPE